MPRACTQGGGPFLVRSTHAAPSHLKSRRREIHLVGFSTAYSFAYDFAYDK